MTSQKRYRHHQDGNNRDRFKDIPPRFKRQKSSSSPTRAQSPPNGENNNKTTHTHEEDFPQLEPAMLTVTATATAREPSSPSVHEFKDKVTSHFESRSGKVQSPPLPSHTTWKHPKQLDSIYFASPWNNPDYMSVNCQQPSHVALGTHFGYKTDLSPLYSWVPVDSTQFYGQPDMTEDPIWANVYVDQRIHHSPSYIIGNNENLTTGQYIHPLKPQEGCWDYPTSTHYPTATSPPAKISTSPLQIGSSEKNHNKKTDTITDKQIVDYSDPDIRTIEMLRELERVADQKERENEEFGADRKSLVSHHLRMLMCAVDRYTEGIEDDLALISRHDEVRPASDSRGSTPGVSADPESSTAYEQTDVTRSKIRQSQSLQSPTCQDHQSVWNEPLISPKINNKLTNQTQEYLYVLSPHTASLLSEQSVVERNNTAAWDLWSSPTFDICNVLTNHNSDISRVRSVRERRPLYERQVQNY